MCLIVGNILKEYSGIRTNKWIVFVYIFVDSQERNNTTKTKHDGLYDRKKENIYNKYILDPVNISYIYVNKC